MRMVFDHLAVEVENVQEEHVAVVVVVEADSFHTLEVAEDNCHIRRVHLMAVALEVGYDVEFVAPSEEVVIEN